MHNKWWVGVTSEETFIHKRKIEHFKNSSMQKGKESYGASSGDDALSNSYTQDIFYQNCCNTSSTGCEATYMKGGDGSIPALSSCPNADYPKPITGTCPTKLTISTDGTITGQLCINK
jgi:hypothetical protein